MSKAFAPGFICAIALLVVLAGSGSSQAGPACANSYSQFGWLAGEWEGSWTNLDFLNSGDVSLEAVLNDDCTGQATIDGIFGQPPGQVVDFTFRDDNGGAVLEVVGDPNFGSTTINVAPDGTLDFEGTGLAPGQMGPETVEGTGTIARDHIHLDYTIGLFGGATTDETLDLTHGPALVQGDIDCSGEVVLQDALKLLLNLVPVEFSTGFDCPTVGDDIPPSWGDVNCDEVVGDSDVLVLLKHLADLSVEQEPDCTGIGQPLAF